MGRFTKYHILANMALLQLLAAYSLSDCILATPTNLILNEGGSPPISDADYQLAAKLIFLAYMYHNLTLQGEQNREYLRLRNEIFGTPLFSVDIFVKWWDISKSMAKDNTPTEQTMEHFLKTLSLASVESFAKTGRVRVDEFWERTIEWKRKVSNL